MTATILHVITALNVGGAEAMLAKLVGAAGQRYRPAVLSLARPGPMAEHICSAGTRVLTLGMREGRPSLMAAGRLVRAVRELRPALLQGWMHHGNLAATVAAWPLPIRPPVVWNVRHSIVDLALEKPMTRAVLRATALVSAGPSAIIYNSRASAAQYARLGYPAERAVIIPNGFDCERFAPRRAARDHLCETFGVDPRAIVVGMVARLHPMKTPAVLVDAVLRARAAGHDLHLLLAGEAMDRPPAELAALQAQLPANRLTRVGHRTDVADWLPGVDIVALPSSWGEGFANILGEAMASGVPCVATDVGDAAWIVGRTGRVVPPRNPEAMAAALGSLAEIGRAGRGRLGAAARARAVGHFALADISERYNALYDQILEERALALRSSAGSFAAPAVRNS